MADFGLDNDFESDDSFFDEPKVAKKSQPTKTANKKSLEDLFGFEDGKKSEKSGPNSFENVSDKPKVRFNVDTPPEKPAPETSKNKNLDWLGTADDTQKDPLPSAKAPKPKSDIFDDTKSDSKKSFDLLDDILPQRGRRNEQAKTTSFEDILKESKAQRSGPSSLDRSGPGSLEKPLAKTESLNVILEPPVGSRRGRMGSGTGVTDMLGLFGSSGSASSEFLSKPSIEETKVTPVVRGLAHDVPDWLGRSATTTSKSETTISTEIKDSDTDVHQEEQVQKAKESKMEKSATLATNFQTNMSNLQTQESFLLVSLQLKKYEENLSEIKNQQQEILRKQENQFDKFFNKYIEKQKDIEEEMLGQQERINDHIRMLTLKGFEGEKRFPKEVTENEDNGEKNENTQLEKIIQSLKQRHEEEFFLMEESYKKQISLMEKSSEQLEHRLSQEIENISKLHTEKLENLKTQHKEEINFWTEKIENLNQKHKEELDIVRENQNRIIREVKDEFLDQIERFKEQKIRETDLFASSSEVSQKLDSSMEKLHKNEEMLEHIQEKIVNDYNILSVARERSIENKEKEILAMRLALDKCREQAEKDRSQLLALIRTLEQKISEQNQNAQEERWAMQQAAATLAARAAAFDREVDFSRASIDREREQLKSFKETLLAEQEQVTMQLTEEKLKLSAEKSRIQVSAKLVSNYEVEKVKTEAETAIQVAKELTEKLNLERSFVQRQKVELDSFRNKLMEKERELLEKEETLEEVKRTVQQKTNEDRRVIQETRHLEIRYKEKLSELQKQAISLSNREKKLAEEKLLISKERLTLYTTIKTQNACKKCPLCIAEDEKVNHKTELSGYPGTDSDIVRLRMEALEDERNSEVSREEPSSNPFYNK
ncbi:unnamed protein product [Ceutorhynchus assimilis]|uniref:Fas-binding factor 1 C-terminal domain-containing protein n=1 Tax=Ceutorhynchus assimilis TaxID=467358 RepID=A0A9N9MFU9_9CUCU|nr:unnamed protein product [Ceutorhynchus assimilis]